MLQVSPFTNVLPLQNFPTYVRHHIHKLPNVYAHNEKADTIIKIALLVHVEILEAENVRLKEKSTSDYQKHLHTDSIQDDKLI